MKKTWVNDAPRSAPADYRDLPARVVVKDGDGLFETGHGSGKPSTTACEGCRNVADRDFAREATAP